MILPPAASARPLLSPTSVRVPKRAHWRDVDVDMSGESANERRETSFRDKRLDLARRALTLPLPEPPDLSSRRLDPPFPTRLVRRRRQPHGAGAQGIDAHQGGEVAAELLEPPCLAVADDTEEPEVRLPADVEPDDQIGELVGAQEGGVRRGRLTLSEWYNSAASGSTFAQRDEGERADPDVSSGCRPRRRGRRRSRRPRVIGEVDRLAEIEVGLDEAEVLAADLTDDVRLALLDAERPAERGRRRHHERSGPGSRRGPSPGRRHVEVVDVRLEAKVATIWSRSPAAIALHVRRHGVLADAARGPRTSVRRTATGSTPRRHLPAPTVTAASAATSTTSLRSTRHDATGARRLALSDACGRAAPWIRSCR